MKSSSIEKYFMQEETDFKREEMDESPQSEKNEVYDLPFESCKGDIDFRSFKPSIISSTQKDVHDYLQN